MPLYLAFTLMSLIAAQPADTIVTDAKKLQNCSGVGIVAFCMFPVSSGDDRWIDYLTRIGAEVGTQLSPREHAQRVSMQVSARGMRPT